jgi:hypothetical protein
MSVTKSQLIALGLGMAASAVAAAPPPVTDFDDAWGPRYRPGAPLRATRIEPLGSSASDALLRWNRIAVDASGLDHTPVETGEARTFGEQLGPGRSSRAMAIVHVAMFDALNAITPRYRSYTGIAPARGPAAPGAAIAQAAHDTLAALYPSQAPHFDEQLTIDLAAIIDHRTRSAGRSLGRRAAAAIRERRADDGAAHAEARLGIDYLPSDAPGHWRQDPISQSPLALGAYWSSVDPFVLESASQFRIPPPPALDSAAYAAAFDEVQRLGGDGLTTPTERTADQTEAGIYWAYDGTPSLCAPPRLYNQIAVQIAAQQGTGGIALARLLALVNLAMADAGVAIWESKYYYDLWRPVTGIREADPGSGPSGAGDGNSATVGDPTFTPLGAPASNLAGPNFTPPFPAYPSGHAGFGGALFQILRRFFRTDAIPLTFVSDEYNGITTDNQGAVRPLLPRSFASLSTAEEENGQSRIYLGIHWAFDKTAGIAQGRRVADYVVDHALRPLR